jgi:hypothetical protein
MLMLDIAPSFQPFFQPVQTLQRVERFVVLDNPPKGSPLDAPADVEAALARLLAEGLVGRASRDPLHLLFGGKSKSTDSEITAYQEPFMISRERDGTLLAGVAGQGNFDESAIVKTLEEATAFVLGIYAKRHAGAR